MKSFKWLLPALTAVLVVTAGVAVAAPPPERGDLIDQGLRTAVPDLDKVFDVNEMLMFVTNQGSWAYDQLIGDAGLEWPKGSGRHAVFASGIWLGATVAGETRVTVGEFSQEFAAGPMNASGAAVDPDETDPKWRVLKLTRGVDDPDPDAGRAASQDWNDWRALAMELGDDGPPVDENGDPMITGDQSLWCVYNDAVAAKHTNDAGFSDPLGVEIRQTTFGFNRTGALGKTVFLDFEIENKGSNVLENMYVSIWFDPDLGGATDDLVGSDTDLSLGFCYNATNGDAQYGATVPAQGCDFFLGPRVIAGSDTTFLGMTSFNKYINGTDPHSPTESYNYMQGLTADGLPQDCDGVPTTFVLTGDPVTGTGCIDDTPADRRFMMSTGPITMNPGEEQRVVAAIIIGGESGKGDRLSNISLLKFYDLAAQNAFDRNFEVASPPPVPDVTIAEMDGEIILTWGSESQNDYDEEGYAFEGYNIYQGESAAGPYRRVATFDAINNVGIVKDDIFNPDAGALENIAVQFGADSGIQHEFVIDQDFIRGGPLRNGTTYHFAVTAYSYGENSIPKTLENRIESVGIVPQKLVAGVDLSTAGIGSVEYQPIDPNIPPPTNVVEARVVNAREVTGHDYELTFEALPAPTPINIDGTDFTASHKFLVTNTTTNEVVLDDQLNLSGNSDFDIFDGIQITMSGVYEPQLQDATYVNVNTENGRDLSWVNWGGRFFNGALDTACRWAGSSIVGSEDELDPNPDLGLCPTATLATDRFGTVEMRFDGTQKGYLSYRQQLADGSAPPGGRGYIYGGYVDVPFTVHKIVGSVETQLQVMFTEIRVVDAAGVPLPADQQVPTFDGTWDPDESALGGREYLLILDEEYSETPTSTYEADGLFFAGVVPALYGGWLRERPGGRILDPEDKMVFTWGNPADENDVWLISTSPATGIVDGRIEGSSSLAQSRGDLDRIRAVPNPYLTRSSYEPDQFNRVIKFTNLPATCTIRLFSLAGDLVRVLEKDDPSTSIVEWDLENRFGLPAGSGIFVYHVDAPSIGSTFGKLAVIMEEERLEDF